MSSSVSLARRRLVLALAVALAVGAPPAAGQTATAVAAEPADGIAREVARLQAADDADFVRLVREAIQRRPHDAGALLDALDREASPERRWQIAQVRREEGLPSAASGSPADAGAPTASAAPGKGLSTGLLVAGGVGLLALAAGGGGGGGGGGAPPPAAQPPAPPPPPPPSTPPESFLTPEFQRNYSLGMVRAQYAYAAGATGRGILAAVVDSGLAIDHPEFAGRIHPAGLVIREGGPAMTDPDGHGTHVAGILAASRNDTVMHGVAFNAQLLPIKYIKDDETPDSPVVSFSEMINALVAHRPRVANNSWGERTEIGGNKEVYHATRIEDTNPGNYRSAAGSYTRVLAGGTVVVFSGGNNVTGDPSKGLQPGIWAALPLVYPELQGQWLAAVSVGSDGLITTSSHRCGDARAWCLAAPGSQIVSTWLNGQYATASGTSMAAPHVSGAIALLAELFPTLTAPQLVNRVLVSANKTGVYADAAVYGQGLLNLQAASQPIGTVSAQSASVTVLPAVSGYEPGPIGDSLGEALSGRRIVLKDSLDAPFAYPAQVLLGSRMARRGAGAYALAGLQAEAATHSREWGAGNSMEWRPAVSRYGQPMGGAARWRQTLDSGRLSVGVGGTPGWSMGLGAAVPALQATGASDRWGNPLLATQASAFSVGWQGRMGGTGTPGWLVSHDGASRDPDSPWLDPGHSTAVLGEWRWRLAGGRGSVGLQAGLMDEQGRTLGASWGSGRDVGAASRMAGVDAHWMLSPRVDLLARAHWAETRIRGAALPGDARTQAVAHALGVAVRPARGWDMAITAQAPLQVQEVRGTWWLPTQVGADNQLLWEPVALGSGGASPRPLRLDATLGWVRPDGRVRVQAAAVVETDPRHAPGQTDRSILFNLTVR